MYGYWIKQKIQCRVSKILQRHRIWRNYTIQILCYFNYINFCHFPCFSIFGINFIFFCYSMFYSHSCSHLDSFSRVFSGVAHFELLLVIIVFDNVLGISTRGINNEILSNKNIISYQRQLNINIFPLIDRISDSIQNLIIDY